MARSACASPAPSSSHSACASSSSRAPSSSKRSFDGRSSPSTSISSLDSCSSPAKRCSCDLTDKNQLKKLYLGHSRSTDGLWHGPLPIDEWKERFLPSGETASHKLDLDAAPDVHDAVTLEEYIARSGLCTTVFPRATLGVHGKDHTTNTLFSADFSILSEDLKLDHDSRHVRDELLNRTLAFGDIVSEKHDPCPFADGKPDTEEAAYTRGRLAAIMRAVAVNSHRTFCYAFVLMPELARLIRFDHAGIVFSELFPWRTSDDLVNFLMSFEHMSPAQRGCDTSVVTIASDSPEALQAREILADSDALPEGVEKSSVIPRDYHGALSLMSVYDDEEKVYHRVVVHRPIKSVEHYIGRSTLGFYGVDLDEKAVVYVKDAWRIASPHAAPEASTYRRLNKHGVPYLPGFYLGGDVPENTSAPAHSSFASSSAAVLQSTRSQLFMKDRDERLRRSRGANNGVHPHVHHRLLFKKIGRPLKLFKSTLQLCTSLMHGLESHNAAYEVAKVLHRDISGGNVLIDKDGSGMLIDWDMCVWLENKEEAEKIGQKIGTWAFISSALLTGREKRQHLLRDDVESFVHILFYYVLRYRPTVPAGTAQQTRLFASMKQVFDTAFLTGGEMHGGDDKACYLYSALHFESPMLREYVQPVPLRRLMMATRDTFGPLYAPKPYVDEDEPEDSLCRDRKALERWQKAIDTAQVRLRSSEYIISVFRKWTQDYDRERFQWAPDDGAVDQFFKAEVSVPAHSGGSRKRSLDAVGDGVQPATKARRATSNLSAGQASRASLRPPSARH